MDLAYADGISGYFEFPTDNARRLLPPHLEPVELHHGSSILSMTVFDIPSSLAGAHRSVAMSVMVVPYVQGGAGEWLPKAAAYPYLCGTTSFMPRQLAGSMFHLPHWNENLKIDLVREGKSITARVAAGNEPVADLTISEYEWEPTEYVYQTFMKDNSGAYRSDIKVTAEISEHEEETGKLVLYDHPFHTGLMIADVYDVPFREIWTRKAVQTLGPLVPFPTT